MSEDAGHRSSIVEGVSPGARDLYILALGLLVGLVLGPWVLGRAHPPTYNRMFTGLTAELAANLDQTRRQDAADRERLVETDVTEVAVEAFDQAHTQRIEAILAEMAAVVRGRLQKLEHLLTGLVLAVLVVMVVEAAVVRRYRGGLVTARYAILGVWVAIAVAQPSLVTQVPVVFTLGLIVVVLVAALVPLGRQNASLDPRV